MQLPEQRFKVPFKRSYVMRSLLMALAGLVAAAGLLTAADQATETTTITVEGMHCAGCAMNLSTKIKAVMSVQNAEVDLATKTAKVTPVASAKVSPKALWEAIVKAGYKPTKLTGPSGTFTKTPDA
jgi:copper chaperone CopZ